MRQLRKVGAGVAGLAALLTFVTGAALAGGWAEVSMIEGSEEPPIAGEEREIRFSLLQHGITAVDSGTVDLTATHVESRQVITVQATSQGGGRWSATVAFPADGRWRVGVTHDSLETSAPAIIAVQASAVEMAWLPAALAVGAFAAAMTVVVIGKAAIHRRAASAGGTRGEPVNAEG